jgi:anti-sigma B factor antagonist
MRDIINDDRHRLVLVGELDLGAAAELNRALLRLCHKGMSGLVIDMRRVTFMDCAGVHMIAVANDMCERHGIDFGLIAGPPCVQRVFELTGLLDVLPFMPDSRREEHIARK